jgi:hypothetical protein
MTVGVALITLGIISSSTTTIWITITIDVATAGAD